MKTKLNTPFRLSGQARHRPKRWATGDEVVALTCHTEAVPPIKVDVLLAKGLEVTKLSCVVGLHRSRLHQRRTDPLTAKRRTYPERCQVDVQFARVTLA